MGRYLEKNVKRSFIPSEEEILLKASEFYELLLPIESELIVYQINKSQIEKLVHLPSEIRALQVFIKENQTITGEQKNKMMNEIRIHLKLWSSKLLMDEGENSFLGLYIKNQMKKYLTDIETIGVGESVVHYCLSVKQNSILNKDILLMRDLLKKAKLTSIQFEYQQFNTEKIANQKNEKLNELYYFMGNLSQMAMNHLKLHDKKDELAKFQLLNIYRERIANNKNTFKIKASKQRYKENIPLNQILKKIDLYP